jgi:hypothetical protein
MHIGPTKDDFDVYRSRTDRDEVYDCYSSACQGRFATVHSFDAFKNGLITYLLHHSWLPKVNEADIRAAVRKLREENSNG